MIQTSKEVSFFIGQSIDKYDIFTIEKNLKKELCLSPSNFTNELPVGIVTTFAKHVGKYSLETYRVGRSDYILFIEIFQTLSFGERENKMVVSLVPNNIEIKELIKEIILNS